MVRKFSKISEKLHLKLNANIIQQYINDYIKKNNVLYVPKKKDDKNESNVPNDSNDSNESNEITEEKIEIKNEIVDDNSQQTDKKKRKKHDGPKYIACSTSYITLTKLVELLIDDIIKPALKNSITNELQLHVITFEAIQYNIAVNEHLYNNYYKYIRKYDDTLNYNRMLAPYDYVKEYLDMAKPDKLYVNEKALNLISFLIVSILNDVLEAMTYIITYVHKSYFNTEMIMTVCNILFKGDDFKATLKLELEEIDNIYKQVRKDNLQKAIDKKNNEINNNEEENKQDKPKKEEDKQQDKQDKQDKKEQDKLKKEEDKPKKEENKPKKEEKQKKEQIKVNNKSKVQNPTILATTNKLIRK